MLAQDGDISSAFAASLRMAGNKARQVGFHRIEPMILSAAEEERAVTSSHEV